MSLVRRAPAPPGRALESNETAIVEEAARKLQQAREELERALAAESKA